MELERVISSRLVQDPSQGLVYNEFFCKWDGVNYSEVLKIHNFSTFLYSFSSKKNTFSTMQCTWEREADILPRFQRLVDAFNVRQASKTKPYNAVAKYGAKFVPMRTQPAWLGNSELLLRDYQLDGLNWLAKAWFVCFCVLL